MRQYFTKNLIKNVITILLTMLMVIVVIYFFLVSVSSSSIETRYLLTKNLPDSINRMLCNPKKPEDINLVKNTIYNIYLKKGYLNENQDLIDIFNKQFIDDAAVCGDKIFVIYVGGGYFQIEMYNLKGKLLDSCEQYHSALKIHSGHNCYEYPGSVLVRDYIKKYILNNN